MFLSSQARILLSEWQSLAKIIVMHSVAAKEKPITNLEELESFDIENLENITFSTAEELPHILSEKQITTALQGPYGALIEEKMSAYATIARFRLQLHLSKEELFKGKRANIAEEDKIDEKILNKISFSDLDNIQKQLDELTLQQDQELQNFISEWINKLIQYFSKADTKLTEREIQELQAEDIATEILPRFAELGIKLPQKDYSKLSSVDYLTLKAILTIQSALSRRHLPHTDHEIQQVLKNFKSEFTMMENQQSALIKAQKESTLKILSALEYK